MTMGIYCIQVEKEDYWQSYVGISQNIEKRWSRHKNYLKGNYHNNQYLQHAWNKYGEKMFEFHILESVDNYSELYELEKDYANSFGYGDYDLCFNVSKPGEKSPMFGRKHTEGTKQKMSEAHKGEKNHMSGKKGEETSFYGKKHTEEAKQKLKEALQGEKNGNVKLTEEQARFILTVKTTQKNQKNSDFKQQEVADFFGVSIGCIKDIMQRRRWQHILPLSAKEYEQMKQVITQQLNEGSESSIIPFKA